MVTKEIRKLLAERPAPGTDWPFQLQELAAAALMAECARIDGKFDEEECDEIRRIVKEDFVLDEETVGCLAEVAEGREDEVWHDWLFTETVKKNFDEYEQLAVIRRLWEIALADATIHPFEERLIARVATELGIPQQAVARALSIVLRRHPGLTSLTADEAMPTHP